MSEDNFEEMINNEKEVVIKRGEEVSGEVVAVRPSEIIVDIHCKSEGVIYANEYSNEHIDDLTTVVKVGDPIKARVISTRDSEGQVILSSKRVISDEALKELEESFENKEILKGKVVDINKGGLKVLYNSIVVFIPKSEMSTTFERDFTKYLNQEIEFALIECDTKSRMKKIVGSRKIVLESERAEIFEKLEVGQIIEGTVKNVTSFGAFVDIGGVDGLLHISNMSWSRITNPSDLFKAGDKVKCFIVSIDAETGKIGLSAKFKEDNPWYDIESRYSIGQTVTGKVARIVDFGVFVELEPGVDALLHISQISNKRIEHPKDVFKEGDEVTAEIVDINSENKRISISVKALGGSDIGDDADDAEEIDTATSAPAQEAAPEEVPENAAEADEVKTEESTETTEE